MVKIHEKENFNLIPSPSPHRGVVTRRNLAPTKNPAAPASAGGGTLTGFRAWAAERQVRDGARVSQRQDAIAASAVPLADVTIQYV